MVCARAGNYLAFFPSYSYLEQVREVFCTAHPEVETLRQDASMDEASRADFLAQFTAAPGRTLLGFAVLGGVFGEGVDLAGERRSHRKPRSAPGRSPAGAAARPL